ncbi:MAG: hypothetical protein AB7D29_07605 [Campylobacterales bacterium]
MDSAKDSKTDVALAFQGRVEFDEMIKLYRSEIDGTVTVEISSDEKMLKFYTSSNFASGTVKLDAFLSELERLELIPPRPKTVEHQAQGLLDIEWHHSLQTEDGGCGS